MPHRPFRFVHASDFHLEMPFGGLAEVPDPLREPLIEAAYTAATRVFDAVLAEEAEILVLSGDVLHSPQTGPRGPLFLCRTVCPAGPTANPRLLGHRRRRSARGLAAGHRVARERPPRGPRPRLGTDPPARRRAAGAALLHGRDGNRLVRAAISIPIPAGLLLHRRRARDGRDGGVGSGASTTWALGGRRDRSTLFSTPQMAHYAGSPQGRRPGEAGVHGCTLVQVDENRQARTHLVPTDAVRFLASGSSSTSPPAAWTWKRCCASGCAALVEATPKLDLLVSWTVAGSGPLIAQLRRGKLAGELLGHAAERAGQRARRPPGACRSRSEPGAGVAAGVVRAGDDPRRFPAAIRQFEVNQGEPLGLERTCPRPIWPGPWPSAAALPTRRSARPCSRRGLVGRRSAQRRGSAIVKITALEIDGYGAWSGLKVERLADGLNVLYGPNEAGKTTLLWLRPLGALRLFAERRHYLPPLRGGRPGGWIEVAGPAGRFQIARHDDAGGKPGSEELALTAADGTRQGEHMLKVLLSNIDEPIFSNVFAVGLREMQELGTLSDSKAAEFLYNCSAGVDRVSLVDVLGELETSRNRILDRSGGPCQVAQLLAEREKLRQDIEQLDNLVRRYGQLAGEPTATRPRNRPASRKRKPRRTMSCGWSSWPSDWATRGGGGRQWTTSWPPWDRNRHARGCRGPARRPERAGMRKCQQQLDELRRRRQELRSEGAALASAKPSAGRPPASRPCRSKSLGSPPCKATWAAWRRESPNNQCGHRGRTQTPRLGRPGRGRSYCPRFRRGRSACCARPAGP